MLRFVTEGRPPQGGISKRIMIKNKIAGLWGIGNNPLPYIDYAIMSGLENDGIISFSDDTNK